MLKAYVDAVLVALEVRAGSIEREYDGDCPERVLRDLCSDMAILDNVTYATVSQTRCAMSRAMEADAFHELGVWKEGGA